MSKAAMIHGIGVESVTLVDKNEYSKAYTNLSGSIFVGHESCPYCGSRDNLARYSDGHGYCFGCKYVEPATAIWRAKQHEQLKPQSNQRLKPLPDDASPPIGAVGWHWLKKYGIKEEEIKNCLWSDDKQWLIFTFRDEAGNLEAWQARNFNPLRPKPKYYTQGPISDIYDFHGEGETLIFTEDILSAIKVGRSSGVVGVPVFGSSIPLKAFTRLSKRFKSVGIWLDMDKARESLLARSRASQYFEHVFSILTTKDPKEYSDKDITQMILSNLLTNSTEMV